MSQKICICVLVGLPASGKSSFVLNFKNHIEGSNIIHYHICYDKILNSGKNDILAKWKSKRQRVVEFVEELVHQIMKSPTKEVLNGEENGNNINILNDSQMTVSSFEDYQLQIHQIIEDFGRHFNISSHYNVTNISNGSSFLYKHLIIIDDNMYYRSMRYEYYKIARKYELSFCMVYFDVNVEQCLKNNICRSEKNSNEKIDMINKNHAIPIVGENENTLPRYAEEPFDPVTNDMIINMNSKLEPPSHDGFENQRFISINHVDISVLDKLKVFIEESFNNPISVTSDQVTRTECLDENLMQICDLCLRKIVSTQIKNYMKNNTIKTPVKTFTTLDFTKSNQSSPLKEFAEKMANIKKSILRDLQNRNMQIELSASMDSLDLVRILNEAVEAYLTKGLYNNKKEYGSQ